MKEFHRIERYLKIGIIILVLIFGLSIFAHAARAATYTQSSVDDHNDFILEPAKQEVLVDRGSIATRYVNITSRIKEPTTFKVEIEDIIGSNQPDKPVVLLGGDKSPYSLKDYLHPDTQEFTLNFGEKIQIPITINIPANLSPGGFYAAVIISNAPSKEATSSNVVGTKSISRVASLFFVRVNGPANQSGNLESFNIKNSQAIYQKADMTFQISFKNTGSIYLVPYGFISIKNIWGQVVDQLPVDAYFSLPNSLRYREVAWSKSTAFGRYTAVLDLNRGYGSTTDEKSISFWVIPYKILLSALLIIIILVALIYFVAKNFEFKRKNK